MCGGIKRNERDDILFKQGQKYQFSTNLGELELMYGGSVRSETLESKWRPWIVKEIIVKADEFLERNTKGYKYQELKPFKVPEGKGIKALITVGDVIRIVTQSAQGEIAKVHNRQPILEDL